MARDNVGPLPLSLDDSGFRPASVSSSLSNQSLVMSPLRSGDYRSTSLMTNTPIEYPTYIDSEDYKEAAEKFYNSTSVVISGPSGAGKTWCANQVIARYVTQLQTQTSQSPDVIFKQFDCASLEALLNGLAAFRRQKTLDLPSLQGTPGWDTLIELYQELNTPAYVSALKFIILDDVESLDSILQVVNKICELIQRFGGNNNWKIIITSQKSEYKGASKYRAIGDNFMEMKGFTSDETLQLFQHQREVDMMLIKLLREQLGHFPLALSIAERHLQTNQFEKTHEFCEEYLERIKNESAELAKRPGRPSRENSAVIAIKISIERMLENDLAGDIKYLRLIQTVACLNQKYISRELLISCAETVFETSDPSEEKPKVAKRYAETLISNLKKRYLCTKDDNPDIMLFSLHALVKQSMELFLVNSKEKVEAIVTSLESLNRLMPKDGRSHQTQYVGYYREHGEKLCEMIKEMGRGVINRRATPMILLLQSDLLIGIGYCLLAQRRNYEGGYKKLEEALDTYCRLVTEKGYKAVSKAPVSQTESEWIVTVAGDLYKKGQESLDDMIQSHSFTSFIERMPLYHRLTEKDVKNMLDSETDVPKDMLVNDHLTRMMFDKFSDEDKVVTDVTKLGKVYIGEVLARIYHVMCKHYWGEGDDREQCMRHGQAGVCVYQKIFDDHGVYLLSSLMIERDNTTLRLSMRELGLGEGDTDEQKAEKLKGLQQKLQDLSNIGTQAGKKYAFEVGLMRSDLSKDNYNEMLCREEDIQCQGRLYALTKKEEYKTAGQRLLERVKVLARQQVWPHSALSYSYKKYATFLERCEMYSDAVVTILTAMMELKEYQISVSKDKKIKHPELKHGRFRKLYRDLTAHYKTYKRKRGSPDDTALKPGMPQSIYLVDIVKHLHDSGSHGNSHQSSEAPGEFDMLEEIADDQNLRIVTDDDSSSRRYGVQPTD